MLASILALAGAVAVHAVPDVDQIHLSMDNSFNSNEGTNVIVSWVSSVGESATWRVTLSTQPTLTGADTVVVEPEDADVYEYTVSNTSYCLKYTSPNIYRALADTQQSAWMKPGTKVYYKISATGVSSPTYSFMLPPATGALNNVKLAVIGDLGQTADSISTVQHVLTGTVQAPAGTRPYDAVLIAGDLSYADAENFAHCSHPGGCVPQRWDSYGQMYQQLGTVVPTFTTPGNHEIELVSVGDLAAAPPGCNVTTIPFLEYRARWFHYRTTTPEALHYSFDIGNVHAVMLNSYAEYVDPNWNSQTSDQYVWLANDLANVDRKATPWIAVFLHAPWYNSNSHHLGEIEETAIRALFEPLLHKYSVDILFAGHVHAYERTYQVLNGTLATVPSFIEINVGDGGNREGPAVPWCEPISLFPWSAYRDAVFGHGSFETFNDTHARWSWIRNNNTEFEAPGDDVWIIKGKGPSAGGVRVHDASVDHPHRGAEWTPGRQQEFVDKYGIAAKWGRASCPTGIAEE